MPQSTLTKDLLDRLYPAPEPSLGTTAVAVGADLAVAATPLSWRIEKGGKSSQGQIEWGRAA